MIVMIRHTVMFRWSDTIADDHVACMAADLDAFVATLSGVVAYRHGPDAGLNDANWDYAITGDFESVDAYVTYRDHPDHRSFIATWIADATTERAAVQYEI